MSTPSIRKSQEACIRFNEGRCRNTSARCRYQHTCTRCKRPGHGVEKCSLPTDKSRPGVA
jgi:hypothetical protein